MKTKNISANCKQNILLIIAFHLFCLTVKAQSTEATIKNIQHKFAYINALKNLKIVNTSTKDALLYEERIRRFYDISGKLIKITTSYNNNKGIYNEEYYLRKEKVIFVYYKYVTFGELPARVKYVEENRFYFNQDENLIQWIKGNTTIRKKSFEFENRGQSVIGESQFLKHGSRSTC